MELVQEIFLRGDILGNIKWSVVVLTSKSGGKYQGIVPVEVLQKLISSITNGII